RTAEAEALGDGRYRITLNRWFAAHPDELAQTLQRGASTGFHPYGSGQGFHEIVLHEAAQIVDDIDGGELSRGLEGMLTAVGEAVEQRTGIQLAEWISLLPGYCFTTEHDPATGQNITVLNPGEALSEGVQQWETTGKWETTTGGVVGSPQWAIREYVATGGHVPPPPHRPAVPFPPPPPGFPLVRSG